MRHENHGRERAPAQAQQIVLARLRQHGLAVHRKVFAAQLRGDPPISVTAVRQRQAPDRATHCGFVLARRFPYLICGVHSSSGVHRIVG